MNESTRTALLQQGQFLVQPKRFVFYDKASGTERFEVRAEPNGSLPVDQAASLMAIHCFVRGKSPKDFGIMVAAEDDLLDTLLPMARKLVQACAESRAPVHLSPRQRDVLRVLMQDSSNKEIACKLNISVRTVKFHVSALFEKFNVQSRVGLMRKAADVLLPEENCLPSPRVQANSAPNHDYRLLRASGEPAVLPQSVRPQPLRMAAGAQRASR
jgi:DNA-binding CsgD family transcriptional regulator